MNAEKLSELIFELGLSPVDSAQKNQFAVSMNQLEAFADLIVDACAKVQLNRSRLRHGYDKYQDADAIWQHFGLSSNECTPTHE